MDKKYQIFISSTYIDLAEQRARVVKTVLSMGHLPIGLEMFDASEQLQWEVIKSHIDNSDYYILIIAHRYGSMDENGIGFIEKEYDYAISRGMPCLIFIIDNYVQWPEALIGNALQRKKLSAFKEKVMKRTFSFWKSTDHLSYQVLFTLTQSFAINPRIGWIRANEQITNPLVAEEISRLSKENYELKVELASRGNKTDEISEIHKILSQLTFKLTSERGEYYEISYLESFIGISKYLISGLTNLELSGLITKILSEHYSIQTRLTINELDTFTNNLYILGIISRSDNDWMLTSKGRDVIKKVAY